MEAQERGGRGKSDINAKKEQQEMRNVSLNRT